uniref:Uncharacterized protein n=1 Tax=Acrobeloides nanus TaxID=290746 RepID=A0A914CFB8_9BILA
MMLRFRINPLRFFGRRTKSTFDISRVMEPLKNQFNAHHLKIELKLKISVCDSMFRGMAVEEQHKFIVDLLPEDLRDLVIAESSTPPEESVDREVRRVYLSKVPILPDSNIPATPQSFLDTALYHLSQSSGALSSEYLWLCGDLALKNFCISNGFNPKIHTSKNRVVDFLVKSFDHSDLLLSWESLNA